MAGIPNIKLNNGVLMPQFGLGVFKMDEGPEVESSVLKALELGYRSIDTAAGYQNEAGVGRAVKASGIKREELFITTKLANRDQGYDSTLKAFDASMALLGLDYLDLYLIHWPLPLVNKYVDTWKAFIKLYKDKRIRSIGVSNFEPAHLERLFAETDVVPVINQVEYHPYLTQTTLKAFCAKHDIFIEAWSPLMRGGDILNDAKIGTMAQKYGKTAAQVVLRWNIEKGVVTIPKSVHEARIRENMNIFDFELDADDIAVIDVLNKNLRIGPDPNTFNNN
ncbi:MAG: aldo/keto reductase [Oscillospiraceae bacterium]|nr:aldo/keto reductase [Oscillospiraceae bacterium]